jgi:hypothetical protein
MMASKRRRPTGRHPRNPQTISHRVQRESLVRAEFDTELVFHTRSITCPCGESFVAAEIHPTCPACGQVLSRRHR